MKRKMLLTFARRLATVTGVLLIAMVFVAWRHGTMDLVSAMKASLQDTEATLREWFSCFHFR